jgi:tight adherence protein C
MTIPQIGLLLLLFLTVFGVAMLLLARFSADPVQQRLEQLDGGADVSGARRASAGHSPWLTQLIRLTSPLAKLSVPEGDWEKSALRTRFMTAGLRNPNAPTLFFAAKTGLAVGLPFITYLVLSTTRGHYNANNLLMWLLVGAALGYYLPNILLAQRIQTRQREIFNSFPDALDLMTVCVEAGLGMDAALGRVSSEIGLNSPLLADELNLVTLELRAGNTKERALRNLALRTGVEDVDALVAMLIQAERFGTSVADSLRVQSDQLRTKRRQRAEEMAAKIALKLLFPLIFFIFPSLLVVLMGPAFIQIYRVLLPGIGGAN